MFLLIATWIFCTQGWFVEIGWNWSRSSEKKFQMLTMYSHYFTIIYFWKRTWLFFWGNLNHLYPRIIFVHWYWTRKSILRWHQSILTFSQYYLLMEKDITLHLNKAKPFLLKNDLYEVGLKLAKRFWKRKVFNVDNEISLFSQLSPLEKRSVAFHFRKKN